MDFVYDFVESIHIFIPIVAVIGLIVIVYFCGIGTGPQPDENYIKNLENLQSKPSRPTKKSAPSSAGSKGQSPKKEREERAEVQPRQRKTPASPTKAPEKEKKGGSPKKAPEAAEADGEWTTVTPKRRPEPRAPAPYLPPKETVLPGSPPKARGVAVVTAAAAAPIVLAPTGPPLNDAHAEAQRQIQALLQGQDPNAQEAVKTESDSTPKDSPKKKSPKKEEKKDEEEDGEWVTQADKVGKNNKSKSKGSEDAASTNDSYSFGTESTRTDSSGDGRGEVAEGRLGTSGEELVEEEEDGVLIISRSPKKAAAPPTPPDDDDGPDSPDSERKKKKKKKKLKGAASASDELDVDDDGEGEEERGAQDGGFTTVPAKKKPRPRRV